MLHVKGSTDMHPGVCGAESFTGACISGAKYAGTGCGDARLLGRVLIWTAHDTVAVIKTRLEASKS